MAKRTAWGRWLEQALRERGLKPAQLAELIGKERSTISQLMTGKMSSLSSGLRENIARALRIATDEVPSPSDLADESQGVNGTPVGATPLSYFPPDEEPERRVLRFIDHGIPDHLLPRLAQALGYFEPFNISLEVDPLNERSYPRAQVDAFRSAISATNPTTLASGPEGVFPQEKGTFVARVNRYKGYALVTRADTKLRSVSEESRPEEKLRAFVQMMEQIADRDAAKSAAFIDPPAEDFYTILWELYNDLENTKIVVRGSVDRRGEVSVLEMLHEIGRLRADFVVGHANAVALAHSAKPRYRVLVEYDDIDVIINAVRGSEKRMDRLSTNPKFNTVRPTKGPVDARRTGRSSDAVGILDQTDDRFYLEFRSYYRTKLTGLMLDNVWGLNLPMSVVEGDANQKALACRLAGVAYRTVSVLLDEEKRDGALSQLLEFVTKHPDTEASFRHLDAQNFKLVWNSSFELTPYEEMLAWLGPSAQRRNRNAAGDATTVSDEENPNQHVRSSLRKVTFWMAEEKKKYERAMRDLERLGSMNPTSEGYRQRAEHHYRIYSYWDAARYAEKARSSARSEGTAEGEPNG